MLDPNKLRILFAVFCVNCFIPLAGMAQNDEEVKIDAEQTAEREIAVQGTFGGIGAALEVKEGILVVKDVIVDTPSARAGLLPGATIYAINGISTKDMNLNDAVRLLRGPVGARLKLDVQNSSGQQEQIELTREIIEIDKPISSMLNASMGMIQLRGFHNETPKSVSKAVQNLQSQGAKGLILDLRGSPGGVLEAIKQITELFLPQGSGLWLYEDKEGQRKLAKSSSPAAPVTLPLVVLVDEKTQVAELMAAAIKRNKRGILIGHRTSGLSVSKELKKNPDGSSKLVQAYTFLMFPNKPISGVGVEPDILLEQDTSADEYLKVAKSELDKKLNEGDKAKPAPKKANAGRGK